MSPGRHARSVACWAALLASTALLACNGTPEPVAPSLGDFVQATSPANGEVLSANKFGSGAVTVFLNFFTAEGRFGFGSLLSFELDGDDVKDSVEIFSEGGPPATSTTLTYSQAQISQGKHEVKVEYTDSRGTVHRIGWTFTIQG
jgi:hypothetical protein